MDAMNQVIRCYECGRTPQRGHDVDCTARTMHGGDDPFVTGIAEPTDEKLARLERENAELRAEREGWITRAADECAALSAGHVKAQAELRATVERMKALLIEATGELCPHSMESTETLTSGRVWCGRCHEYLRGPNLTDRIRAELERKDGKP